MPQKFLRPILGAVVIDTALFLLFFFVRDLGDGFNLLFFIPVFLLAHITIGFICYFFEQNILPVVFVNALIVVPLIIMATQISARREYRTEHDIWIFEQGEKVLRISNNIHSDDFYIGWEYEYGQRSIMSGTVKKTQDTIFFYQKHSPHFHFTEDNSFILSDSDIFFITEGFLYHYDSTRRIPVKKVY